MLAEDLSDELACSICGGSGSDPVPAVCSTCGGDMVVRTVTGGVVDEDVCEDCEGEGEVMDTCRRCGGTGKMNRYGPGDQSEQYSGDVVILAEEVSDSTGGLRVQTMAISDKEIGGFDERYGSEIIEDFGDSKASDFPQDLKDRLQNNLGASADVDGYYRLPSGAKYSKRDLPGRQWPSDPDLSINQIIGWLNARGDSITAGVFEDLDSEIHRFS